MCYKQLILTTIFLSATANNILAMEPQAAPLAEITSLSQLYDISGKKLFEVYNDAKTKNVNPIDMMSSQCCHFISNIHTILSNNLTEGYTYFLFADLTISEQLRGLNACKIYLSKTISNQLNTYIDQMTNKTKEEAYLLSSAFFFRELLKNRHINYLLTECTLFKSMLLCDINYIVKMIKETTINGNSAAENDTAQALDLLRAQTNRGDGVSIQKNQQLPSAKTSNVNNNRLAKKRGRDHISMNMLGLSIDGRSSCITKIVNKLLAFHLLFDDRKNVAAMRSFATRLRKILDKKQGDVLLEILSDDSVNFEEKKSIAQEAQGLTPVSANQFFTKLNDISARTSS